MNQDSKDFKGSITPETEKSQLELNNQFSAFDIGPTGAISLISLIVLIAFAVWKPDNTLPLLPPLIAIGLSLATRQVYLSLFAGIWAGAMATLSWNGISSLPQNALSGFARVVDTWIINGVADADHASIIVFSLAIGGMVGIISASGGTGGIVEVIVRKTGSTKNVQLSTWAMGIAIFFDDYANTLLVGNTMKPIFDRFRISREKLAYIVDCTAAPIASLALISTWIGYEVSLIGDSLAASGSSLDPYMAFVESIPYRFYSILTMFFVFATIWTGLEFGPMLSAEKAARLSKKDDSDDELSDENITTETNEYNVSSEVIVERWHNAVIPIAGMIVATLIGLWWSGRTSILSEGGAAALQQSGFRDILSSANSFHVLLWSSFFGSMLAGVMAVYQKHLTMDEAVEGWIDGAKSMIQAVLILALAWAIGSVCSELGTAELVAGFASKVMAPALLPAVIFLLSGVIAFATGTSWGTMAILTPIAVQLSVTMGNGAEYLIFASVGAILAGSSFGDHCSPISDTTVMSSMASGCNHIEHVRTQLPYALSVGACSLFIGYIPAGFGISPFITLPISALLLYFALKGTGQSPEPEESSAN